MGIPYTFLWKLSGILTTLSRFWNALIMVVLPLPHKPHSITPHLLPEVRLAARLLTCASTASGQRNVPPKRHTSPSTALLSSFAAVTSSKGSLKRSFVVLGRDSRDISVSISWGFPYCSMSACIQSFDYPVVEMAPAVALVPLAASSDSLLLEEVTDISAQPAGIDFAVFSFRQQAAYLYLPCSISKQDGFEFIQRFMSVIPRGVSADNIFVFFFVFVFIFIFYIGMGQLYGQLTGQLRRNLLWQLPGCLQGQRIECRGSDSGSRLKLYQSPFHKTLPGLADILLGGREPHAEDGGMAGKRHLPTQTVRLIQEVVVECHLRRVERTALRFRPEPVDVVVYACHDLPFRTVDDVLLRLLVKFRLRCHADILHPRLQFGLVEEAQFAVGLVVRDDAAHHQLVKIAHFDAEEFRGLGCRDQLVRLFHISVVLM